jgi:LPS-assembly lipoprotein
MLPRRQVIALLLPALLAACDGWAPLYADRETGLGDEELRAIRVAPIPERVGQRLELALRDSLNPSGIPTPNRYLLSTTLQTVRSDLGVQSQGLGTRGKLDATATFRLTELRTGKVLLANSIHVADSFDILASGYASISAEDDARVRAVEELRREIVARLTTFMQRRRAEASVGRP